MSCGSESKSTSGGCCGGCQPFPWFDALTDPSLVRLYLRRHARRVLTGLLAGAFTGTLALLVRDPLAAGLSALGAPWLPLHPGAVIPATLLAGLALSATRPGSWARAALCLALGGAANAWLRTDAAPALEALWPDVLAFAALGLPALGLLRAALAWTGMAGQPPR